MFLRSIVKSVLRCLTRHHLIGIVKNYYSSLTEWQLKTRCNKSIVSWSISSINHTQSAGYPDICIPEESKGSFWAEIARIHTYIVRAKGAYVGTNSLDVVLPDRSLIGELLFNDRGTQKIHLISSYKKYYSVPKKQEDGKYATIWSWLSDNYAYWLTDSLARLWVLRGEGDYKLLVPDGATPWQLESLAILGWSGNRIRRQSAKFAKYEFLLVPSFASDRYACPNGEALRWLAGRFQHVGNGNKNGATAAKRYYLSRAKTRFKRVVNEDEVIALLSQHGFEVLLPENHSFEEQISLFRGAGIIVSPFGASLANALFCRPGTWIVELVGSRHRNPHYINLSRFLGFKHVYVTNYGLPSDHQDGEWKKDFGVSIDRLKRALEYVFAD